jgi:hypothetical protein
MSSIADPSVIIQSSSQTVPRPPTWFGEVVLIVTHLRTQGILSKICERIRFARARFGRYEVIDFLAVLFGYAISGERTLEAFYEVLSPFAVPFMALFGRDQMPSRSALSRFLAALTQPVVEALRTLFLEDGLARPLCAEAQEAGLLDRQGTHWIVFEIDGTREAARQRALPQRDDLPAPHRRLDEVCAPGYTGRKRGEVVRTRTTVNQAHSFQWLGSFGNRGNGRYREELRQATSAIDSYLAAQHLPRERALVRLDGQYGTGAVLADVADFSFVTRGKDYAVLNRPEIQTRLHLPADQSFSRPESAFVRQLYDCPDVAMGPGGVRCRVVVATHLKGATKPRIGLTRKGVVYELFLTNLPREAFTAADVLALYLHRGAFEPTLSDEDQELDPDRWCSHSAWGQEAWQCIAQWTWNLRLELGHHLKPEPVRTTEFAPALDTPQVGQAPPQGYDPPVVGTVWKAGYYSGEDFALQADGTVCCPEGKKLFLQERRQEQGGSVRLVYEARIADCRGCEKRPQCQWHGQENQHPRRVSVLLHPRSRGSAPLLWHDWPRRKQRRACIQVVRHQHLHMEEAIAPSTRPLAPPAVLTRSQRARYRLSWDSRLARNARTDQAGQLTLRLFGIPEDFAIWLGLTVAKENTSKNGF